MKKKFLSGMIILLLGASAILFALCYSGRTLSLRGIEQIRIQQDSICYVDCGDNDTLRIIRSDTSGGQGEVIACSRHTEGKYRTISQLFFDDQENAYVLIDETETDSFQRAGSSVWYCDFKRGELVRTAYDSPDSMQQDSGVTISPIRDGIDGTHQDIETVTLSMGALIRQVSLPSLWVLSGCALLILYWYIYCRYRVDTILIRIMLAFVLTLALADRMIEEWIDTAIREELEQEQTVYEGMAVKDTESEVNHQLWHYQRNMKTLLFLLLSAITVFLLVILFVFLRPLKHLRVCANRLAAGEMGVTVRVRGHDEIANIGAAFNQMSLGLSRYINDMREISDGYYRFIPAKILELLGKDSISQLKLGDEISGNMAILSMYAINHPKQRQLQSDERVYETINQLLSVLVAPIVSHHGVVEHFEGAGLTALFAEGSQEALDAAIEIYRSLDSHMPGEGRSIAITHGRVMIGVIGNEARMEASAISVHADLAKMLRLRGDTYGARILITHRVCQQIPDFEGKYHARYLGNVRLSATDALERLYDVYDGDDEETFYYKELTKALFEKGVHLFVAKKFYDARLVFVEVLKQHRRDRAAKEYLYRCDRYYKLEGTEDTDTVLETF